MKNLYLIPTDKPSRLHYFTANKEGYYLYPNNELVVPRNPNCINQHIYITSNEELVLGGYHFNSKYGDEPQKTNQRDIDSRKYWEEEDYDITKIILTTDQDLIKDGIQVIDDEFLEWFVKNPSCEEVEVERGYLGIGGFVQTNEPISKDKIEYKIIIPKEESKQEIVEEREPYWDLVDKKAEQNNTIDLDAYAKGVQDGVKWQHQQSVDFYNINANNITTASTQNQTLWKEMYSEEDMAESFMACWKANVPEGFECKLSFNEWFKQFKQFKKKISK